MLFFLKKPVLYFLDLGLVDYQVALERQVFYHQAVLDGKKQSTGSTEPVPNFVLFCQHPPVYTIGSNGKQEHILVDASFLKKEAIACYRVNRGGGITYHGPGQLVVYFILDLEPFLKDIHKFIRLLESVVVELLDHFSVKAHILTGYTGVWLEQDAVNLRPSRKICSIGLKFSRWVTMHGLALNVNNDLAPFAHILPCGLNKPMTSMRQELHRSIDFNQVTSILKGLLFDKLIHNNYHMMKQT